MVDGSLTAEGTPASAYVAQILTSIPVASSEADQLEDAAKAAVNGMLAAQAARPCGRRRTMPRTGIPNLERAVPVGESNPCRVLPRSRIAVAMTRSPNTSPRLSKL